MIKLWADDIRPAPDGWHWAKTVTEAIRVLDTQPVSEVSLDHDISHDVQVNGVHRPYPCGETFEPVARFIGIMHNPPGGVCLHSANPVGREKMRAILKEAHHSIIVTDGPCKPCNRLEGAA